LTLMICLAFKLHQHPSGQWIARAAAVWSRSAY
jgi:hypothetical protein